MAKNICIIAGARPNFVKVSPLVRAIGQRQDAECLMVYAGREDDPTLEPSLFADLQMPRPQFYLGVDSTSLNEITSRVMAQFDAFLDAHPVDVVIVVDDLASTMAAAIVTKKRAIPLAHLVAGTRSFNINMPKEINRLVIDALSDYLFTAGVRSTGVATREQSEQSQTFMVGNILMDTLRFNYGRFCRPASLPDIREGGYIVFTLNRKALIADRDKLAAAKGIVTDSGNVAEEATFNGVPCITLNDYTEHQETVSVGSNVLVGEDPARLADAVRQMVAGEWKKCALPDRWDGRTADRILQILLQ